jgi:hypothetical protein
MPRAQPQLTSPLLPLLRRSLLLFSLIAAAGAVAPFLFISSDAPRYIKGNWVCFGLLVVSFFLTLFLWWRLGGSSEYDTGSIKIHDVEEAAENEARDVKEEKELEQQAQAGVVKV